MDCVDPCQPTQSCTVGSVAIQGGSVHWQETHRGGLQTIRAGVDDYVEPGQHNVDVGLSLQGQFY